MKTVINIIIRKNNDWLLGVLYNGARNCDWTIIGSLLCLWFELMLRFVSSYNKYARFSMHSAIRISNVIHSCIRDACLFLKCLASVLNRFHEFRVTESECLRIMQIRVHNKSRELTPENRRERFTDIRQFSVLLPILHVHRVEQLWDTRAIWSHGQTKNFRNKNGKYPNRIEGLTLVCEFAQETSKTKGGQAR